jgi:hypothetical protein
MVESNEVMSKQGETLPTFVMTTAFKLVIIVSEIIMFHKADT